MATTTVSVPVDGNSNEIAGWMYDVSATLAAGNDIAFVDRSDTTREVNVHRLLVATAGTVKHRAAGQSDHEAKTCYYIAGGWHDTPGISKIFVADTDASLDCRVAIG